MQKSPTPNQKLGNLGEKLAKKHLLNKGYQFIQQNFRSKLGEIDLIFQDKEILVFVEVKTRVGDEYGPPEEAITPFKIRHLIKAVAYFQLKNPNLPESCRIDVIAVQFDEATHKLLSINHYQNITL